MQERPENFNVAGAESEATLVAPRFDAEEARRANPVVPLAEGRRHAPSVDSRAPSRRDLRRSWPPALVVVALLAAAAVGGAVATSFSGGAQSSPAAVQAPAAVSTSPADEVPDEALAEAPPEAQAPTPAAPPREETRADRQPARTRAVRDAEEEATRAAAVPPQIRRGDDKEFEGEEGSRRGRGKGREHRRAREEDDVEKEMRKALKDAKGKVPRLVDVITVRSN
jgi:type IV secretory pathway VirB10-like protein